MSAIVLRARLQQHRFLNQSIASRRLGDYIQFANRCKFIHSKTSLKFCPDKNKQIIAQQQQYRNSSGFQKPFGGELAQRTSVSTFGGAAKETFSATSNSEEPGSISDIRMTEKTGVNPAADQKVQKGNKLFRHFTPVYLTSYLANKEKNVVKYIKLFDLYGEHLLSNTPLERRN